MITLSTLIVFNWPSVVLLNNGCYDIFCFLNLSSSGALKGHGSIKGSGPLTVDTPWGAAVSKGRGWGIVDVSPKRFSDEINTIF